ncbi:MAG: hypothetical protein RMJ56_16420 [Gemmataceae bacterium]|nr:hypothetical protein [Gemmata sp.]MDW8199182.1 hypothetical protein [Gemmataceae bacterium]
MVFRPHSRKRWHIGSRGVVSVELLFTLPLVVLAGFLMVGIADLVIAEQKLDEAAGRAGRIVAMGGSEQDVRNMLTAFLGPERAQHTQVTLTPLKRPEILPSADSAAMEMEAANFADAPPVGAKHRELIEVRIELEVRHATVTALVPLGRTEKLIGRTVVPRH